ncbi:MAG: glycoside hydrolase family 31 protein [Polyangiales bacterium]
MKRRAILPLCLGLAACSESPSAPVDAGVADASDAGAYDGSAADAADSGCAWDGAMEEPPEPALHTPRWAFEPWISKDISDRADTYAFVDGFISREIPVGAVVLDSPWETHYNTFIPSPTRYGDFPGMVRDMHMRGVRVVLWTTQLVNSIGYDLEVGGDIYRGPAENLAQGDACGFFVNDSARYMWWKGTGSSVDFFNPRALAWWHRQQDVVLDAGIDGWKLDFGDSYVTTARVSTARGMVSHQEYSERYYRDFLAYGVQRRGREFVTMVRAYDESYQFPGRFFARREHAPVVWMGDNRRDWVGLSDALDHTFRSARAGYVMLGSDLGGYLDRDDRNLMQLVPYDPVNFARWTAVSALALHAAARYRGNLTPWTAPEQAMETVARYRYWAHLHHALVPYLYAHAQEAYAMTTPVSLVRPVSADANTWANDYRYMLGDALLVAPILDATGRRDVPLPIGRWFDWWDLGADPHPGETTLSNVDATDLLRVPLYVREGSILPLRVDHPVLNLGSPGSALTLLVFPRASQATSVRLHEGDAPAEVTASQTATAVDVTLPMSASGYVVGVRVAAAPTAVSAMGRALATVADRAALDAATEGWFYEPARKLAWVRVAGGAGSVRVSLAP